MDGTTRITAAQPTYRIVRFFENDEWVKEVIETGLTLEEARAHCHDPQTASTTATDPEAVLLFVQRGKWFDGFEEEA